MMMSGSRVKVEGRHPFVVLCYSCLLLLQGGTVNSTTTFKIINKCRHTIWPGLLSGATSPPLPTTGFSLPSGRSFSFSAPTSWSGRIWARTLCSSQPFSCLTADCGSGSLQCSGSGAKPPATLAEFTLNGDSGLDFYDVSLVDGFNLPLLIVPRNGRRGSCSPTGCLVNLNRACPTDLSVNGTGEGKNLACRSACEAFGDPQYCCSGAYSTPETCPPSVYSQFFKNACPRAYSYAYDDKTSTYTCAGASYWIIFCPLPYTSQKVLGARKDPAPLPLVNKTMMYISR
ncbi:hypothetical protein MLD38_013892 [Melastoma candidum]|uniref:Uncharacterized protein n=1 Tax=Melastoma candidum TaxID=119954 RepID=A0ACB9REP9_9MYRT|nr:hypothetical protein MLD38_013892 [Melastoma candidum]